MGNDIRLTTLRNTGIINVNHSLQLPASGLAMALACNRFSQ
jgi:hypothetical protein